MFPRYKCIYSSCHFGCKSKKQHRGRYACINSKPIQTIVKDSPKINHKKLNEFLKTSEDDYNTSP